MFGKACVLIIVSSFSTAPSLAQATVGGPKKNQNCGGGTVASKNLVVPPRRGEVVRTEPMTKGHKNADERQMIVRILLLTSTILLSSELPTTSKGSAVIHDDPYNPHHIDDLPAEVRQYIAGICRGPARAEREFATYSPREKRWRINLEYLQCHGLGEFRRGNQCLDVDFIEVGTRYRLSSKVYRDCGY